MADTHGKSGTVLEADEVALVIKADGAATLCLPDLSLIHI